jgi:hypothetical protein
VCVLQVADAREHTLELRALMDARDSGTAWDPHCNVREKLIEFLQREYPECLPRTRAELQPLAELAREHHVVRNLQMRIDERQHSSTA